MLSASQIRTLFYSALKDGILWPSFSLNPKVLQNSNKKVMQPGSKSLDYGAF